MKSIQKRLAVLLLAAVLTGRPGGLILRGAAEEVYDAEKKQQISMRSHGAVFTVLGISFLCAGGMVVLIVFRDRR